MDKQKHLRLHEMFESICIICNGMFKYLDTTIGATRTSELYFKYNWQICLNNPGIRQEYAMMRTESTFADDQEKREH